MIRRQTLVLLTPVPRQPNVRAAGGPRSPDLVLINGKVLMIGHPSWRRWPLGRQQEATSVNHHQHTDACA
jgi:hypothetical protein